jgi:hypothetical protein
LLFALILYHLILHITRFFYWLKYFDFVSPEKKYIGDVNVQTSQNIIKRHRI